MSGNNNPLSPFELFLVILGLSFTLGYGLGIWTALGG